VTYSLKTKPRVDKIFEKLGKKDPVQLDAIHKKVKQILEESHRFKPLRAPMQHIRRVHIMSSFVLLYTINESEQSIELLDYDHHDNVYQ
jgi:YafQ family addiction module toxin component